MNNFNKLSIIIPAFNEEKNIEQLLEKIVSLDLVFDIEKEIIIINDCSSDNTLKIIEAFIAKHNDKSIKVISNETNKGKGESVHIGIAQSTGDYIIIQDADLELDPRDIPSMIACLIELDIEFINGSRYIAGVNRPLSSYKRYLANKLFTFLTSIMINVKITDIACGYKLIKKSLFYSLNLKERRFGFEAELIIKALRFKKNNIAEVAVRYFPRNEGEGKKLRNSDAFKILWVIFKYGLLRFK